MKNYRLAEVFSEFALKTVDYAAVQCQDYVVRLPLEWLCNTTGQAGIGVSQMIGYQINPAADTGSANLDGDEAIDLVMGYPTTGGETPLDSNPCTFLEWLHIKKW